jgi:hypothetical protein
MMIATCKGAPVRSGASLAGAAAFDINLFLAITAGVVVQKFSSRFGSLLSRIINKDHALKR